MACKPFCFRHVIILYYKTLMSIIKQRLAWYNRRVKDGVDYGNKNQGIGIILPRVDILSNLWNNKIDFSQCGWKCSSHFFWVMLWCGCERLLWVVCWSSVVVYDLYAEYGMFIWRRTNYRRGQRYQYWLIVWFWSFKAKCWWPLSNSFECSGWRRSLSEVGQIVIDTLSQCLFIMNLFVQTGTSCSLGIVNAAYNSKSVSPSGKAIRRIARRHT